jgi:hypothetical protein
MIDPEVARLRRLRDEALRVRQIARRLGAARWGNNDPLLNRGACASWRLVRVVTGKLIEHPYLRYQQGPGLGTLLGNRLAAEWIALTRKERSRGLNTLAFELQSLSRQLDDARALTWSTDFSDALGRSRSEISRLVHALATETQTATQTATQAATETHDVELEPRLRPARAEGMPRTDSLVGGLAQRFERDWPYLAF